MILTGKEDLRVQKTIAAIKNVFEDILTKKNFEDITVKELCARAKINKKTFYTYYPTLSHLLTEIQGAIAEEYIKRVKDFRLPEELDKVTRVFFEYAIEQGPVYEKISCHKDFAFIRTPMIDKVMSSTWGQSAIFNKMPVNYRTIYLGYITEVSMDIYKQWVADGKKIPLEEIISLTNTLLLKGSNGFLDLMKHQGSKK